MARTREEAFLCYWNCTVMLRHSQSTTANRARCNDSAVACRNQSQSAAELIIQNDNTPNIHCSKGHNNSAGVRNRSPRRGGFESAACERPPARAVLQCSTINSTRGSAGVFYLLHRPRFVMSF